VSGVDPSAESIRAARATGADRTEFLAVESVTLPFPDATFDLIHSNGTFHHIPHADHPAILRELHRVLKPGGDLFIFENNPYNATVLAMKMSPLDREARMILPPVLGRREAGRVPPLPRATAYYSPVSWRRSGRQNATRAVYRCALRARRAAGATPLGQRHEANVTATTAGRSCPSRRAPRGLTDEAQRHPSWPARR
jgi:SAM-dependent methyltransferase